MSYVIYSEERGVYLGNCMGLGFWSKWDTVGQEYAVTFSTERSARDHVSSWDSGADLAYQLIELDTAEQYATIDECVAAGLPRWEP